jgi:hypothetical protein
MSSNQRPRQRGRHQGTSMLSGTPTAKQAVWKWHDIKDYWFRSDDGRIVIAETPNAPLIIFMISVILAVVWWRLHLVFFIISLASILFWAWLEARTGASRFRRLLGWLGGIAGVVAILLMVSG